MWISASEQFAPVRSRVLRSRFFASQMNSGGTNAKPRWRCESKRAGPSKFRSSDARAPVVFMVVGLDSYHHRHDSMDWRLDLWQLRWTMESETAIAKTTNQRATGQHSEFRLQPGARRKITGPSNPTSFTCDTMNRLTGITHPNGSTPDSPTTFADAERLLRIRTSKPQPTSTTTMTV
jgi:hypothetical protein